jgi:Protein of unknown function (DUF3309)
MSLGTILLIVLVLILIGVVPTWGHSRAWGYVDYGDVTIPGTGTTLEPLRDVDRPIAFRNQVTAS